MISPPRRSTSPRIFGAIAAFFGVVCAGAQPLTLTPLGPTGIYDLGEKAGWTVAFAPQPTAAPAAGYTYTLKKNTFEIIQSGSLDPAAGEAVIATTLDVPAMLYLEVTLPSDGEKPSTLAAGAAIAPTELQPVAPCPADFDAFWASKIEMLHAVAPEPVLTPADSGREGVDYATLKLKNIRGAHVYGQLAKPAREGKFPAVLVLQWAGAPYPLQKSWVTDRAAEGWIALNIEPHDVPGNLPPEFYGAMPALIKSYNTIYADDRDRNYFLQMYLGAYRAVDYLASRPDWDGETLLVTGISMGGQQSLAVAGLHPRITHLIVHVPAGADSNALLHGRFAGYPNWDATNPKVMETALYFDTVNFASRIKATSLISMGFLDNVCPAVGIWTAFNQIRAPKEVVPLVDAAHNHQSTPEQQRAFLEREKQWLTALVHHEPPPIGSAFATSK
jgi:cephalosporin-C deacetylase-like acetyl esterase